MRFGRHFREVEKNFGAIERSSAPLYADSNRPTEELPHLKNFDPKSREGRAYIEKKCWQIFQTKSAPIQKLMHFRM